MTVGLHHHKLRLTVYGSSRKELANISTGTLVLAESENFAKFIIRFDQAVIIEPDHADAVSSLLKERAVTFFTLSQLPLLTVHKAEQQCHNERIDCYRDKNVLGALFDIPTLLRVDIARILPVNPREERRPHRHFPKGDHPDRHHHGEANEEDDHLEIKPSNHTDLNQ